MSNVSPNADNGSQPDTPAPRLPLWRKSFPFLCLLMAVLQVGLARPAEAVLVESFGLSDTAAISVIGLTYLMMWGVPFLILLTFNVRKLPSG